MITTSDRVTDAAHTSSPQACASPQDRYTVRRAQMAYAKHLLAVNARRAAMALRAERDHHLTVAIAARDDRTGLSETERLFVWAARG